LFAVQALRKDGKKAGLLRLKTIWPFAEQLVREVGKKAKRIFVPEMNRGQIAGEILKYADCDVISYSQTDGEIIHPHKIVDEVRSLL
jgi:2-oxoglutarate ferredoxin oxidoreductase subunit alpha